MRKAIEHQLAPCLLFLNRFCCRAVPGQLVVSHSSDHTCVVNGMHQYALSVTGNTFRCDGVAAGSVSRAALLGRAPLRLFVRCARDFSLRPQLFDGTRLGGGLRRKRRRRMLFFVFWRC